MGSLQAAKCTAEFIKGLPQTQSARLEMSRDYVVPYPTIEWSWQNSSGVKGHTWLDIDRYGTGEDHHIEDPFRTRNEEPLTEAVRKTLYMKCRVDVEKTILVP